MQCVKEDATQQKTQRFYLGLSGKVPILPGRAHNSSSVRFLRGKYGFKAAARPVPYLELG